MGKVIHMGQYVATVQREQVISQLEILEKRQAERYSAAEQLQSLINRRQLEIDNLRGLLR